MRISTNKIKYYASLNQKKYREKEGKFIVEGSKLISEALANGYNPEAVFATNEFLETHKDFADKRLKRGHIIAITNKDLLRITDTKSPQGIAAVFGMKKRWKIDNNCRMLVAAENIADPGNLGSIMRNCDWFGFKNLLLSPDCAEIYNPKTIRSSAGSLFHLNVRVYDDFYDELKKLKEAGYAIITADMNGEDLVSFELSSKGVIVFSNEANGPTEGLIRISDRLVTIPKFGDAESLNVASASAVLLSHLKLRDKSA